MARDHQLSTPRIISVMLVCCAAEQGFVDLDLGTDLIKGALLLTWRITVSFPVLFHLYTNSGASKAECLHVCIFSSEAHCLHFFTFPSTLPTLTVFRSLLMSSFASVLKYNTYIFLITQVRYTVYTVFILK